MPLPVAPILAPWKILPRPIVVGRDSGGEACDGARGALRGLLRSARGRHHGGAMSRSVLSLAAAVLALPLLIAACRAARPEGPRGAGAPQAPVPEASVRPDANARFLDPGLDVESFVDRFEGESREIATSRDGIVAALELRSGETIADVGAGTGLFVGPFARAVGARGRVLAIDISPGFLEHLGRRVEEEGLSNVEPRLGGERSVELDSESVDVAFVCDTYHHFEYPRSMLASLWRALRPGGRLVIVDFERIPGVSREWILGHVRAGKETVVEEIRGAGFVLEGETEVEGLEENYLLRFRKPR